MAESPNSPAAEMPLKAKEPKAHQEFKALVLLGIVALICVTLLAMVLAFFLKGSAPVAAPVAVPASAPIIINNAAPTPAIQRPSEPVKPKGERASAMDRTQPALPGVLATATPPTGVRQVALTRADPPSPPSPALQATPDPHKVYFRVRVDAENLYQGKKALPMPVRYVPDAQGRVPGVFASHDVNPDTAKLSYAPDVPFVESGVRGRSLDIQVGQPRKTSAVDGFRAPKGFQFFTAKMSIRNQGAQPVMLRVDDLEVHDAEGLRYLANPELVVGAWPLSALTPTAGLSAELSFLVPESSPLKELAVQEAPGQMALVPLQAR